MSRPRHDRIGEIRDQVADLRASGLPAGVELRLQLLAAADARLASLAREIAEVRAMVAAARREIGRKP